MIWVWKEPSEWAKEKLFQLLNHRHVEALPTVITTNTSIDEMDPHLSSRILERSRVKHIKIQAPDYRKTCRAQKTHDTDIFNMHLYQHMRFDRLLHQIASDAERSQPT